ncbi:TetR/AcrR family transcriptional regulator [Pseudohoeflea suaedae]|nr:TetR/AcrR family transcriptional regulator [Pseudohoeflea suaedae]
MRSQVRYDLILACAEELLMEKGAEGFKMSDLSERSGVPFGSLYQYFPDRTSVIATLAERYNHLGHRCVADELARLDRPDVLRVALERITHDYYDMFVSHPVMLVIWEATQGDRMLQRLDAEDGKYLAGLLFDAIERVAGQGDAEERTRFCRLVIVLIAAAVRDALTMEPEDAARSLARFSKMLPESPD